MDNNSTETLEPNSGDQTSVVGGEEESKDHLKNFITHIHQNKFATNTELFSYLALLNAYVPDSYLLMSECQTILGPPDPIHGGPPFEERMGPYSVFIKTSSDSLGVQFRYPVFAQISVELLALVGISRSTIAKNLMFSLCGDQPEPHIIQFVKDLLTKREMVENVKEKFSRLIEDIHNQENFHNTFSVLKTASDKLRQYHIFPQTISRLYYIRRGFINYDKAEKWAKIAIKRALNNSYVADTLGQVYKNRLLREAKCLKDILNRTEEAFRAFKDVEMKADKEESPEMQDTAGIVSISDSYNDRGHFGFMQVAKIAFEKLGRVRSSQEQRSFIENLKMEVEAKFEFFEWYLAYSKPDIASSEPRYFWKDIAVCYEHYTKTKAAETTSFPGLLDCLHRGLFTSKGRRAQFEETEMTVPELEAMRDDLKTAYEANVDDVTAAERYILSNINLSNKMFDSPQHTAVNELQTIIHRFLASDMRRSRSSEFHLLVLLLFWPEAETRLEQENDEEKEDDEEEEEELAIQDGWSEEITWEDFDVHVKLDTSGENSPVSPELMFDPDLQQHATFMEQAFDKYAKYLRGRYLLPLFFLGKGFGLSKWIHKSRLDAIVEGEVDAELPEGLDDRNKAKWSRINELWSSGKVWQIPKIQDILLPVRVEVELPHFGIIIPQEHESQEVFVYTGEKKIKARVEVPLDAPALSPMPFYLGFTIQGPVVFKTGFSHMS